MAQNYPTDAGVLTIPGGYARYNVVQQNSGLATTGVIMLVGEAEQGPDFTQETDIASNFFGPGQIGDVKAKYVSGRLVDAFNGGAVPANDPQIQGAPAGFILVKTNPSTKATAHLYHWDSSEYGTGYAPGVGALQDKSYGKLGNLISFQVTAKTSEAVPTTGAFALMLPIAATDVDLRLNGGASHAANMAALDPPTTWITTLAGIAGITTTGGAAESPLTGTTGTLAITVLTGNNVQIDRSVVFDHLPVAGDTLYIPTTSAMATSNAAAAGSYIVTGTGGAGKTIYATKLLDVAGTPNQLTTPTSKGATAIVGTADVQTFSAITVSLASTNPVPGTGKSLQIDELSSHTGLLNFICWKLVNGVPTKVNWITNSTNGNLITSATEYVADLTESRQVDNIVNDIFAGGAIALEIGYEGTTATATIDGVTLTVTAVGGANAGTFSAVLADYPTIADLAAYFDSLTGFTCAPGTAVLGSQPSTSLDQGTYGICSTFASVAPGRIKQDAYKFFTTLAANGFLTQLNKADIKGLPAPTVGVSFLSGGAKGATTDALIQQALDALKMVRGNFVVPLFSRDASADIADGLTDPSSTYTIAAVHANTRSHVLQMSTLKKRRNRQAFLSLRDTIANAKEAAGELASFRCSLSFQDVRDNNSVGTLAQFQPWMNAVKAAGMQAAGFYKAIFNKGINISGALQAAGDFNDQDDDAVELALEAGLLTIARPPTGGFRYVSDQTTYGRDNNFVYNSIQAVYDADIISLTTAQIMEQAFVGQSLADVTVAQALSVLDAIMDNLRRVKLIAFSDDAPKGYKNPVIKISGPAMVVSAEVKAATALYFIPITFSITQVQQSS
jgi:hypothetical protein